MKAFICILLVLVAAGANAGILPGIISGGGVGYSSGGGHVYGHGNEASIVKVIHQQQHLAPAHIVKVIHEEPAPQIVQVVHEDHGPVVHHVKVIHEHAAVHDHSLAYGHGHGGSVKIIKVIQNDQSHGWA